MDYHGAPMSSNFEDRTAQPAFEGALRYMIDPQFAKIRHEQEAASLADALHASKKFGNGAFLKKWLPRLTPDELQAMREGHYTIQDARFVRQLHKHGAEMLDPDFQQLFYGAAKR